MSSDRSPVAWHLWVVGVFALLWHGMGSFDYTMTQTQGDAWLAHMEPSALQMAYFHGMPAWTDSVWAIGVWGGLLGAVLLLARRKWAMPVFVVSLLGWAAGAVYSFGLSNGMEAMGPWWPMLIVKGVICACFVWYARMAGQKGLLR